MQCTMTAPSRILQSKWEGGFSCSLHPGRQPSRSDFAVGKRRLPSSGRDGGKACTSWEKNSFRSLSLLCIAMYNCAKRATLFWRTEIFFPSFFFPNPKTAVSSEKSRSCKASFTIFFNLFLKINTVCFPSSCSCASWKWSKILLFWLDRLTDLG